MSASQIDTLQRQLRSARDAVLASIERVTEEEAHQIPAPDEWTVAQLLAHIAEIQSFWMEWAYMIIQQDDPQITRSAVENDERAAAVEDHSHDGLLVLERMVREANDEAVAATGRIAPGDLGRPGHREANPMTVAGVVEYLAGHVKLHADQITESLRLIRAKG